MWELAKTPIKNVLIVGLMSYMMGSQLSIFSIMFAFSMITMPVKSILQTNALFAPYEKNLKDKLGGPKSLYVFISFISLMVALYKFYSIGILPTSQSDWLSLLIDNHPNPNQQYSFAI